MSNYLDYEGLKTLVGKIKDLTSGYKNQDAFNTIALAEDNKLVVADNSTDTVTFSGSNISITADVENDKIVFGIDADGVTAALGYTPVDSSALASITVGTATNATNATNATEATHATSADSATNATNATNDENGLNIATNYALKSEISSVYRYKGSVASSTALPTENQVTGDVYNVEDTGANYAWTGTAWDKLSETVDLANASVLKATQDGSGNVITTTYATKEELSSAGKVKTVNNVEPDEDGNISISTIEGTNANIHYVTEDEIKTITNGTYTRYGIFVENNVNVLELVIDWGTGNGKGVYPYIIFGTYNEAVAEWGNDYTFPEFPEGKKLVLPEYSNCSPVYYIYATELKIPVATNAEHATVAEKDSAGNVISTTYATKSELETAGKVKTVNNVEPDEDGNITLPSEECQCESILPTSVYQLAKYGNVSGDGANYNDRDIDTNEYPDADQIPSFYPNKLHCFYTTYDADIYEGYTFVYGSTTGTPTRGITQMAYYVKNSNAYTVNDSKIKFDYSVPTSYYSNGDSKLEYIYVLRPYSGVSWLDDIENALENNIRLNTGNCSDLSGLFYGLITTDFNHSVKRFNTSICEIANGMFANCTGLTSAPEMLLVNVTSARCMFLNCDNLVSFSSYMPKLKDASGMFSGCTSLTSVSIGYTGMDKVNGEYITASYNPNNLEDCSGMFANCTGLITAPSLDTSKVTNAESMFFNCTSLTTVPEMNTSKIKNMSTMFAGCSSLTEIPWEIDMSSCTDCQNMFSVRNGTSLTTNANLKDGTITVILKNVPVALRDNIVNTYTNQTMLDLIGTPNYTVVNYI